MNLIRKFATKYKLNVELGDSWMQCEEQIRSIYFETGVGDLDSAVIYDIEQDLGFTGPDFFRKLEEREKLLADIRKENRLGLCLLSGRLRQLLYDMNFDVTAYDNFCDGGRAPDEFCKDDAWYTMLKSLGFKHFGGDDTGVTFTFLALCPKSAKIALMLAGHRDEYRTRSDDEG